MIPKLKRWQTNYRSHLSRLLFFEIYKLHILLQINLLKYQKSSVLKITKIQILGSLLAIRSMPKQQECKTLDHYFHFLIPKVVPYVLLNVIFLILKSKIQRLGYYKTAYGFGIFGYGRKSKVFWNRFGNSPNQ